MIENNVLACAVSGISLIVNDDEAVPDSHTIMVGDMLNPIINR